MTTRQTYPFTRKQGPDPEDPVFVVHGVDGANRYHRRIHGWWRGTEMVPKAEAVADRRRPCGVCYRDGGAS